jgi:O-succinylbenzoic acid--CoA ligase
VSRLVALDLEPGLRFASELRRVFDDGDAAWPVDQRIPRPAREKLFAAMRPSAVVTEHDVATIDGGVPTEEGDALVIATSGTTGEPKGVVLTMDAVVASAIATSDRLAVDAANDRWLCCLPLSHVGGLSVLLRAIVTGTPVEIEPRFDPVAVADAASRGATLVSLVATALGRLVQPEAFRKILLGGSAPFGTLGPNVVVTYGLTETGSGVVYDGVPLDGVDVAIDEEGTISLRGPMLLRVYRDGRDPKSSDGWLRTGDIGSFDPSGRLLVHGRADECIVTGGENVWPEAVEAALTGLPGIAGVAVAGVPDPEWGERVVAYVVADGSPPPLDALRSVVRAELGAASAPREVVIVDELPRTSSGKVRRRALRTRTESV